MNLNVLKQKMLFMDIYKLSFVLFDVCKGLF